MFLVARSPRSIETDGSGTNASTNLAQGADFLQSQPAPTSNVSVINEFNPDEIIRDPALRKQIDEYSPDIQAQVRRAYILKGPTQPIIAFPRKLCGNVRRAFSQSWYVKYDWIEYSESCDAAFCFYCFLFKEPGRAEKFGYNVFSNLGFSDWKHAYRALPDHVGGVNSAHNNARSSCDDFRNQRQSVSSVFSNASRESEELYKIRLTSSLACTKYLTLQGLSYRGHDEKPSSSNKGNFLEMVDWYKDKNEEVRDAYDRAPRNCIMTSPSIQKELAKCCAQEITDVIRGEIGGRQFSMLVDESRDIAMKEQMAVIVRFVNC